jgi:hypothetical protein
MQDQAISNAREMQRRATLPPPLPKSSPVAVYSDARGGLERPPVVPMDRPDGMHHQRPSQQARLAAAYGRTQSAWFPPKPAAQPQKPPSRRTQAQRGNPPPSQPQSPLRGTEHQPKPASPPLPDIGALFERFTKQTPPPESDPLRGIFAQLPEGAPSEEGMDSILVMLLLFLLRSEGADQPLLLALMYIMM